MDETIDVVQRRAQLVTHVMDKVIAQLFSREQRLVALGERTFGANIRRHIDKGQQRSAV